MPANAGDGCAAATEVPANAACDSLMGYGWRPATYQANRRSMSAPLRSPTFRPVRSLRRTFMKLHVPAYQRIKLNPEADDAGRPKGFRKGNCKVTPGLIGRRCDNSKGLNSVRQWAPGRRRALRRARIPNSRKRSGSRAPSPPENRTPDPDSWKSMEKYSASGRSRPAESPSRGENP